MAEVVTPKKPIRSSFSSRQKCVVCGSFLDDPRKRVKLKRNLPQSLEKSPVVETARRQLCVMVVSKVCTPSSKYFAVKRPPAQEFTYRLCFHSSKTLRPRHTIRQIAATSQLRFCTAAATRLLALILSLRYVERIQTNWNSCDR